MPKEKQQRQPGEGPHSGRTFSQHIGDRQPEGKAWPAAGDDGKGTPQILDGQPALSQEGWLPAGVFAEVDELREEHHSFLHQAWDAVSVLRETRARFESEDAARAEALLVGEEYEVTPTSEREDELRLLDAKRHAAVVQLGEFLERATRQLVSMESEWRGQLAQRSAEAEAKLAEADELLRQAEREEADVQGIRMWLDKHLKPHGGRFQSAPALGTYPIKRERNLYMPPSERERSGVI